MIKIKLIDEPTGMVVKPMRVFEGGTDSPWTEVVAKRKRLLKIHNIDKDEYYESDKFETEGDDKDHYIFSAKCFSKPDHKYEIYHPRYDRQAILLFPDTIHKGSSGTANKIIVWNKFTVKLKPNNLVRFSGKDRFIFGTNLPWLDGKYGHDLGENVVIKKRGANYLDPTKPDKTDYYTGLLNLHEYFKQIRDVFKCRILRFWVFEACEGLKFPHPPMALPWRIKMDDIMKGNIKRILNIAQKYGIYIYWCLLTTQPTEPDDRAAYEKDKEIIRSAADPDSSPFLGENGVLWDFIDTIKGHPNVFAIDVMNEPEGYRRGYNGETGLITWSEIQKYIKVCRDKIKELDNSILVSCGSAPAWIQEPIAETLSRYTGLGLDFYDFHIYNDIGSIINKTGDPLMSYDELYKKAKLDRPCIIGEFGQGLKKWSDELQKGVARNFIEQAWHLGYGGCLYWYYNFKNFVGLKEFEDGPAEEKEKMKKMKDLMDNKYFLALIDDLGSPRPVSEVMSAFGTDYKNYTDI